MKFQYLCNIKIVKLQHFIECYYEKNRLFFLDDAACRAE